MKHPAQNTAQPTEAPEAPSRPTLLFPTIACLLCTIASWFLLTFHSSSPALLDPLLEMLLVFLLPIALALSLLLIYSLLELAIIHRTFRPAYLLSIFVILLSAAPLFPILLVPYLLFYLAIAALIAIILALRKAPLYNPLIVANLLLTPIILTSFALYFFDAPIPYSINIAFFNIAAFFLLPIALALTFLTFARLPAVRLTRPFKLLLYASFLLTFLTFASYLAILDTKLISEPIPSSTCCGHYPD